MVGHMTISDQQVMDSCSAGQKMFDGFIISLFPLTYSQDEGIVLNNEF